MTCRAVVALFLWIVPLKPVQLNAYICRQQTYTICLPGDLPSFFFLPSLLFSEWDKVDSFSVQRNHLRLILPGNYINICRQSPSPNKNINEVQFQHLWFSHFVTSDIFSTSIFFCLFINEKNRVPTRAVHCKRWQLSDFLLFQQMSWLVSLFLPRHL